MKLILEAIKSLIRKVENLARVNATELGKVSKSLPSVSNTANTALRTAKKAKSAADNAQTTADAAQSVADAAQATANSAATEASKRVKTYKYTTKFDVSGAVNIGVGESFVLSQSGKWFYDYLKNGDVVSCILRTVDKTSSSEYSVSLVVDSEGGSAATGLFIFYSHVQYDASSVKVFTVFMQNYTTTSRLTLHRIV